MSALIFRAKKSPRWFAEIVGEILYWAGPQKIMWSVDWLGQVSFKEMVQRFIDFQMPEELQEGYGYPAISHEDRRLMFGLNLANLLGVDPTPRGPKATAASDKPKGKRVAAAAGD
jgi:hypothetical protein